MIEQLLQKDQYLSRRKCTEFQIDYDTYQQEIKEHNLHFMNRKLKEYDTYFNDMFKGIDDRIQLDLEQRKAILTDEDYNLIVAGAGSGKTTTMTAKIKYMIEKCHIPADQILAISFARKNVEELKIRLQKDFHLPVTAMTFHQLGNSILKATDEVTSAPAEDSAKYRVIRHYLEHTIFLNQKELERMLKFLSCYFDVDPEMSKFTSLKEYHAYKTAKLYQTLKGNLEQYNKTVIQRRKEYRRTINNEYLRSGEEVMIANFLYLHGIDYYYEKRYPTKRKKGIPYHPDFTIEQGENVVYLEHFGIRENRTSNLYSLGELNNYCHQIDMKKKLHERNHTILISTYSEFNDGRSILEHLEESLKKLGFVLTPQSDTTLYHKLMETDSDRYFYHYILLLNDFISQFKLNEKTEEDLKMMYQNATDLRTKEFLRTFYPIFRYYQAYLKEHHFIDFEDMIVKAYNRLKECNASELPFHFKYIIIDEYQDISKQRYDLIKALSDCFQASIVAVGDDWQSIFAFAGSNVELFSKFVETMGYGEILKISNTYRNAQELIDIAGDFVAKDESHIKKSLISKKHIDQPIVVYSYQDSEAENPMYQKGLAILKAIATIVDEQKDAKILLLGRYGFDINHLVKTGLFRFISDTRVEAVGTPDAYLEFFTVHRSKGLEYDYTIIINAIDSTYGFPSKVKDDPIFDVFEKRVQNMAYAEERRLFYVALTRTKNKAYIIVPESKPSPFVIELKENQHVEFKDDVIRHYLEEQNHIRCPKCGSFLKKAYFDETNGLVYRCINEKEVCDFMTTELNYKIPIEPCPSCKTGYLVLKGVYEEQLLIGCTNYSEGDDCCNCHRYIKIKRYASLHK